MAVGRSLLELLVQEAARKPFSGSIMALGRQTLNASASDFTRSLAKHRLEPRQPIDRAAPLDDRAVFAALGFDVCHSIDYCDFEGATHIFDLNQPSLPAQLEGQYDVVLDSGTIEHVFHVPNALQHMVRLAKIGGRIILQSPSSNHIDHGFYMFSPTLFVDYFAANKLSIETLYVIRYSPNLAKLWDLYEYRPGPWGELQCGGLDGRPYLIFVVATKTAQSTVDAVPQQSYYAATWSSHADKSIAASPGIPTAPAASAGAGPARAWKTAARHILGAVPGGMSLAHLVIRAFRKPLHAKKLVGRI